MLRCLAVLLTLLSTTTAEVLETKFGEPEPTPAQVHTFNLNLLMETAFQGINYGSPLIEKGIRTLKPAGLRFPGGTLANNYLWEKDSFSEPTNDMTNWAGEQLRLFRKLGKKYDLSGYIRLCKRNHLEPIWVLNVYEETPGSTVALIRHLHAEGLFPKAIEMGNEPYWDGRSLGNVNHYLAFCRPLAAAIRKEFPEIVIGGCLGPIHADNNFQAIWNEQVAKEDWCQAIVYHEYYGGQGFAMEAGAKVSQEAMLHPEAMVDEPMKLIAKLAPGKPVWFTEWNLGQEAIAQWNDTGAEIHYLAATFQSLIDHRDSIEWACFHQMYDNLFGTYHLSKESGKLETNPSWEYFRLLGATMDGAKSFRAFSTSPADKAVYGFSTTGPEGNRLLVINRSSKPRDIRLPESFSKGRFVFTMDAPPEKKLPLMTDLVSQRGVATATLSLPPYSITFVGAENALVIPERTQVNLFPRRPDISLWYPPYASEQPRFNHDGIYVVKTESFKDKETAIIKMDLVGLSLQPGKRYSVEFDVRCDADSGFVIQLPAPEGTSTTHIPVSTEFQRQLFTFIHDPTKDGIAVVLLKDAIVTGRAFSFRDFVISPE